MCSPSSSVPPPGSESRLMHPQVCSCLSGESCAGRRVQWAPRGQNGKKPALSTTLQCSYETNTTGRLAKQWAQNEEKENHSSSNITHQNPIASPPRGLISRHRCNRDTGQYSLILTTSLLWNAWDLQLVHGAGANLLPHHFSQELVAATKPWVSSPMGDNGHLPITLVES